VPAHDYSGGTRISSPWQTRRRSGDYRAVCGPQDISSRMASNAYCVKRAATAYRCAPTAASSTIRRTNNACWQACICRGTVRFRHSSCFALTCVDANWAAAQRSGQTLLCTVRQTDRRAGRRRALVTSISFFTSPPPPLPHHPTPVPHRHRLPTHLGLMPSRHAFKRLTWRRRLRSPSTWFIKIEPNIGQCALRGHTAGAPVP